MKLPFMDICSEHLTYPDILHSSNTIYCFSEHIKLYISDCIGMCPHQPLPSIGSAQKTPFFRKKTSKNKRSMGALGRACLKNTYVKF